MGKSVEIFLAADNSGLSESVARWLDGSGYHYVSRVSPGRTRLAIIWHSPQEGVDGVPAIREIREHDQSIPVLLITAGGCQQIGVEALRLGICDFLQTPLQRETFLLAVRQRAPPAPAATGDGSAGEIIGESRAVCTLREAIGRIAASPCTVLITGETGTGKELAANLIHRLSQRRDRAFICVNCAALPDALLESELFGYERGAFTGAVSHHPGKLPAASGGIVFLDEVGDLSPAGQAKLLRALESGEIFRLGATRAVRVDVRIIAATNRDLETMARNGLFRLDLFYRLNVAHLQLTPLRDRPEDLPQLIDHYLRLLAHRFGRTLMGISPDAMALMREHSWPGNVRELRNILETAYVHARGPIVQASDLPLYCTVHAPAYVNFDDEGERVRSTLNQTRWNVTRAAGLLHWSRMTLYRKMAHYGIRREHASRIARYAS